MSLSDILGIAALIVSVVGIPIAFVLARRTRQRPDLRYAIDFDVILDPSSRLFDEGLYMTLGDNKIDSISRSRVAIWNERGDTINRSDILATDPLRLQFNKDDKPLQSRIISMSRRQIAISAIDAADDQTVLIDFDFLDAKDGGVLEVIHQGTMKPTILGTLRGSTVRAGKPASLGPEDLAKAGRKSAARRWLDNDRREKLFGVVMVLIGLAAIGLTFILVRSYIGPSRLVNFRRYDLNTIKGQIEFTNAASSTTYYSRTSIWLLGLVIPLAVAFAGFAIYSQYTMVKRIIPGTITVYRPSDQQQKIQVTSATNSPGSNANSQGAVTSTLEQAEDSGHQRSGAGSTDGL